MKILKITLPVLAVLLLTVPGQNSNAVVDTNKPTFKQLDIQLLLAVDKKKKLKLHTHGLAMDKKKLKLETHG
ncbi:hypothetical protein [Psychroserpens luteus]|uniref:Uncharacterized protein n=1 Tax=Psychroserpens luteus TaxID=1434066 RepID=A0ABW5ZY02_9FLAO|nr:hypothetical protein [Psychroserpens luteus]